MHKHLKQQLLFQFGEYTLNPNAMSLRRGDEFVRLPPKALETLLALVRARGEVVTKQQLMDTVWPGVFVEEGNLAQNVFLLRKKLGQTAEGGDYIETLPKRGYRISVPVTELELSNGVVAGGETLATGRGNQGRAWWIAVTAIAVIAAVVPVGRLLRRAPASPVRVPDFVQITHDTRDKRGRTGTFAGPDAALLTDGARLYFTSGTSVWQVSVRGGEPAKISVPFPFPQLLDYSVARSELLVAESMDNVTARPLWSVPLPAGVPQRLGNLSARDAAWSPDGHQLAFTDAAQLYLSDAHGSAVTKIADLPGLGWRPRWSPDGKLLRLTIADVETNTEYLWEVQRDGGHPHRLLQGWNHPSYECCGVWSPDGRQFVFQATRDGKTDVWSLPDQSSSAPVRVSHGQLNSLAPAFSPDGKKLFVIGEQLRGELQHFDSASGQFVPYLQGISADFAEFSRDGKSLLYVAYPEATLWRARADGSNPLQLTFPPLEVMVPHWSPDGKRILFHGIGGGHDEIYLISSDGGDAVPVAAHSGKRMMNETWSPDGNSIAYSDYPFFGGNALTVRLHILDLRTKHLTDVPGSQGKFAPAWSPDGLYIAASSVSSPQISLFNTQTGQWRTVAEGWDLKKWSRDGKHLFFMRHGSDPAIVKVRASDGKTEGAVSLKNFAQTGRLPGLEFSLDLNDAPMLLKDTGTEEIYSMDWTE